MADWHIERDQSGQYWLKAEGIGFFPAIVGKAGLIAGARKREGDMATPVGRWAFRHLYYRQDLLGEVECVIPKSPITPQCGWCDDPAHEEYNRLVKLPFSASHEMMWRDDGAYDLVVSLGFNDAPPEPGRGSAIFLHCIALGKAYTAGCVALARADFLVLLQHSDVDQFLNIDASLLF